jgi:hypothetical protein
VKAGGKQKIELFHRYKNHKFCSMHALFSTIPEWNAACCFICNFINVLGILHVFEMQIQLGLGWYVTAESTL